MYTRCGNWVSVAEPHTVDSDVLIIGVRSASLLLSENNFFPWLVGTMYMVKPALCHACIRIICLACLCLTLSN